jgi:hypothetical protein
LLVDVISELEVLELEISLEEADEELEEVKVDDLDIAV